MIAAKSNPTDAPLAARYDVSRRPSGSALVITLALLVIITILAVGMTESVRMNRTSSNLYADRAWAALCGEAALEQVVAKLQKNTADPERYWISQPGQLVVGGAQEDSNPGNGDERKILTGAQSPADGPNPAPTTPRIVWLHSGVAATTSFPGRDYLDPPNLNVTTFQDPGTHVITDRTDPNDAARAVQMRVRWNYVRKDGSVDIDPATGLPSESPDLTSSANPIVGRYAYWADDESAKINYNLAWTRSSKNTTPIGNPSRVTLAVLSDFPESLADAIHDFVTPDNFQTVNRFYNTPEDARQVSEDVAKALQENKFEVTHYNNDPDTTFFNQPRIVLTTQKKWANGHPFLDILTADTTSTYVDPGTGKMKTGHSDIDVAKLTKTLNMLNQYLSRTDWPIMPGTSFQAKYYQNDPARLTQLSLNIIDYVRSKESAQQLVPPLRGKWKNGEFDLDNYAETNAFIGNSRNILITEVGLRPDPSAPNKAILKVEVYAPENYVFGSGTGNAITLKNKLCLFAERDGAKEVWNKRMGGSGSTLTKDEIRPGEYSVVTIPWEWENLTFPDGQDTIKVRVIISLGFDDQRLNAAPLGADFSAELDVPINRNITSDDEMQTLQVDDPRVNTNKDAWKPKPATWGAANTAVSTLGQLPAVPQADVPQDCDASGNITDDGFVMPAPGGPDIHVTSVGELGYVHTGMESSAGAGVPWRTLRLQPNGKNPKFLPDWAFMDLFTVPVTVPEQARILFAPHDTATGGRVNINAKAEPFGMERILPLAAVLQDAPKNSQDPTKKVTATEATDMARNIYNRTWAAKGSSYGYVDGYNSPGAIAEVKGVADGGEASEELVRQIANLITARGNVFSVYTIGQALKQTPDGRLVVTAENRQQSMVERCLDAVTDKVRFRTVYSRPLSP